MYSSFLFLLPPALYNFKVFFSLAKLFYFIKIKYYDKHQSDFNGSFSDFVVWLL